MDWMRRHGIGGIAGARMKLAAGRAQKSARSRLQGLDGFGLPGEEGAPVISRKDAEGLAAKFGGEEHPFTACMADADLQKRYPDEEQRAKVCGAMKAVAREQGMVKKAERFGTLIKDRLGRR